MRLKHIKLSGFKSFVDLTKVPFEHEMTAVVGPNGCGKSNIIDAVRWVLGESSAKNLRGDMMTDVIFNGAKSRKPVGIASVELFFENTQGKLQGQLADRNEISIRRTVNRDGINHYFLNGSKCRRKDITDIFLGTGLGPRSYAIIEQGTISRLIESKPQELRVFIEEAAGVSKYKERRRETEISLRHTNENLARVDDIQAELTSQIEKLQSQAKAAEQFRQLKAKERELNAQLACYKWQFHQKKYQQLQDKKNNYQTSVIQLREQIQKVETYKQNNLIELEQFVSQLDVANESRLELSSSIAKIEQSISYVEKQKQQVEKEIALLKLKEEQSQSNRQKQQINLARTNGELRNLSPQYDAICQIVSQQTQALELKHHQLADAIASQNKHLQKKQHYLQQKSDIQQNIALANQQHQMLLNRLNVVEKQNAKFDIDLDENEIRALERQITEQQAEIHQLNNELELVNNQTDIVQSELAEISLLIAQKQGLLDSVNDQLESYSTQLHSTSWQNQQNTFLTEHKIDTVGCWSQSLDIPKKWQSAFESVTQYWLQAVQTKQSINLDNAVEELLLLYPNKEIKPIEGTLSQWFTKDEIGLPWLSKIYLAENINEAQQQLNSLSYDESIICPDGTWLGYGFIRKGQVFENNQNILQQQNLKRELVERQQTLKKELNDLSIKKENIDKDSTQIVQQTKQLSESIADKQIHLQQLQSSLTSQKLAFSQQQKQQEQLLEEQYLIKNQLIECEQQLANYNHSLKELNQLFEQVIDISSLNSDIEQLQQSVNCLQSETQTKQDEKHKLALKIAQLKQELSATELNLEQENNQLITTKATLLDSEKKLESLTAEKDKLAIENNQLSTSLIEHQAKQQKLIEQRQQIQLQIKNQDVEHQKNLQQLAELEGKLSQTQLDMEGHQIKSETALEQLQVKNYQLSDFIDKLPENLSIDSWNKKIKTIAQQITQLGPINLAAIDEYQTQIERQQYLQSQQQDLQRAVSTLESVIATIDKETRQRFKSTFDRVNDGVKELFPKIFGGGSAYLTLTGEDLLETGVTIMARPPGKKNSTIHLLSGGEKALTALSLVFAIFRLNPAPFCMLDEVDAPLDDVNVGRFCNLVREMSNTVQFVYISHNKIAIEMASHLTGVTMFEPGVSRMVAVDVDEAIAMAEVS